MYTRPNKPKTMHVTRRRDLPRPVFNPVAAPIYVDSSTECHVTPATVAARMAGLLPNREASTLEPHAGTGNLIRALIEGGHAPESITAIERHCGLMDVLEGNKLFESVGCVNSCFLEYAKTSERYSQIIMNPPFKTIKAHMKAAISLLDSPGVLVALVPITYEHPEAELIETLDSETFSTARVNTKIIRIERG